MPKSGDDEKRAIVPVAVEAATMAAATHIGGAVVAGAAVVVAAFVQALWGNLQARRERRLHAFVQDYLQAGDTQDPEIVEAQIHALGDDPDMRDTVLEAIRGIDEALADVVVPALARLARLYTSTKRPADGFFRGMRRILQDLTAEAFAALIALLRTFKDDPAVARQLEADPSDPTPLPRLIFLLRTHWLATVEDVGRWGSTTGPLPPVERAILSRDAALQILAVIDSGEELRWVAPPRAH
jgi:hypothetical protein